MLLRVDTVVVNDVPPLYLTSRQFAIPELSTWKLLFAFDKIPVYVGDAIFYFPFSAACVAVLMGSPDGDVLATLDKFDRAVVNEFADAPYNKSLVVTLP